MSFPKFKYHPNPIETGSIEASDATCEVCNQKRGYRITSSIYCKENVDNICPWCVTDGTASKKYRGEFVADIENWEGLAKEVVDEISTRTVGFSSCQEEIWLTHCNDGCEFHGLAKVEDVRNISEEETQRLVDNSSLSKEDIDLLKKEKSSQELHYLFKFQCRHCSEIKFLEDLD